MRSIFAFVTCLSVAALVSESAHSAPIEIGFDENDPTTIIGPSSLQQSAGGVTLTMRGYQLDVDGSGNQFIFGPAPTVGPRSDIFNYDPRNIGEPGIGLLAVPVPGFEVRQTDDLVSSLDPGFDGIARAVAVSFEWLEIRFSQPVDIAFIDVDDVTNNDRDIWAVGTSAAAFDYSRGLLNAIAGLSVVNARDSDASDGPFRHNVSGLSNVLTLLIGAPPGQAFGPIQSSILAQFYITGLGFNVAEVSDVPIPGALPLMASALGGFFGFRKLQSRRRSA